MHFVKTLSDNWTDNLWNQIPYVSKYDVEAILPFLSNPEFEFRLTQDEKYYGYINGNTWIRYSGKLIKNLENYFALCTTTNIMQESNKFAILLDRVLQYEIEFVINTRMAVDKLVHIVGVIPIKQLSAGFYQYQLHILKQQGFNYIITETSDKRSAKIIKNLGHTKLKSWSYLAFDINLNDEYTVWIKKL
jgi:hypothetical protein